MNGRTCQLCGKPLSRIWAGGGGDFCSREHRNQHRLRCGMDTLLEANKHASLMRRRDQPRQFSTAQLQSNSAITPRAFGPIRSVAHRPLLRPVPGGSAFANPRIQTGDDSFLAPPVSGGPADARPRAAAKVLRRPARPVPPLHMRSRSIPVALERAGTTSIRFRLNPAPGPRRSFVMLAQPTRRPVISDRAFRSLDLPPLGSISGRIAHRLKLAGKKGNAFRVSGSIGFRLPSLRLTKAEISGPATRGFQWPDVLTLRRSAHIGLAILPSPEERDFPLAAVRAPIFRKTMGNPGLEPARSVSLLAPPTRDSQSSPRFGEWRRPAPETALQVRDSGLQLQQSSVGPKCLALKILPAQAAASHRLERAPFEPQDKAMIGISYPWNSSR